MVSLFAIRYFFLFAFYRAAVCRPSPPLFGRTMEETLNEQGDRQQIEDVLLYEY